MLVALLVPVSGLQLRMQQQQNGQRALANGQQLDAQPQGGAMAGVKPLALPAPNPTNPDVAIKPGDPACVMPANAIRRRCQP